MSINRGNADTVVMRMRERMPVGSDGFDEFIRLSESGLVVSSAVQKASDFAMGPVDGTYLAWLGAPQAAHDDRAAKGLCTYHVERVVLSGAEREAFGRIARCHKPLKKYFVAQEARAEQPVVAEEPASQLDRIEGKLDRLLSVWEERP